LHEAGRCVASLDVDMNHSNNTTPLTPNTVISNYLSRASDVTWHQSFKTSGIYSVPDIPLFVKGFKLAGLQYCASYIAHDGGWYGRSAQVRDGRNTNVVVSMDPRWGKYPWSYNWDQSFRKKFQLGESKQTLEFTWELFNSMNANTLRSWNTTNVNSSNYLQPDGVTPLLPNSILARRIYEWGITFKF
jgi:hypothetical protein